MKKHVILALLTVVIVGLISACSKNDPEPESPIVGQWDIHRYVFTDFTGNYTVYNGFADSTAAGITSALGLVTDTYTFKNDNSYSNAYTYRTTAGGTANATEAGSWALASTTLTLTPTSPTGQSPYTYTYNNVNELNTNKVAVSDSIEDPKTKVTQLVKFNYYLVYRKKK